MKKVLILVFILSFVLFYCCEPEDPTAPKIKNLTQNQLVLSKIVALGNSITAGFQSSGLMEDFQLHSYPYLIAQQMGKAADFEQPIVDDPGIGNPPTKTPQYINSQGEIVQDDLTVNPLVLLSNAMLARPYDNLGVPGANMYDMLNTTSGGMFDLILRNPNFANTTQVEQAIMLQPTLLLLWIGNNDVLGAALYGDDSLLTSETDFQDGLTAILTKLRTELTSTAIIMANIPSVTDIPYVNMCDIIFRDLGGGLIPVLFDNTFQPIDIGGETNLPMLTAETGVAHVLLPGLAAYQSGIGVPDSATLVDSLGFGQGQASQIVAALAAGGLTPTGIPMPDNLTLTTTEVANINDAVSSFNTIINNLAVTFQVPIVNTNSILSTLNTEGIDGYTGHYVLVDMTNTAFSLDGVHPNNGGQAIIANAFISVINQTFGLTIPSVNTAELQGQYAPSSSKLSLNKKAIESVKALFR